MKNWTFKSKAAFPRAVQGYVRRANDRELRDELGKDED